MTEHTVDLKAFVHLIVDSKDIEADLILDEGCTFETEDPKPLVKVINYVINYLSQSSNSPLAISLDLMPDNYRLSFMAYTDKEELEAFSEQVGDALKDYNAELELKHEKGKYVQIILSFKR
jgi:hypothetical protein